VTNWFAGIGQATSGLDAARYGLSVVSQNIANADTDGYTRQVVNQGSVDGIVRPSLYTGRVGGTSQLNGVTVLDTARTTDPVLDARVRNEHAKGGAADTTAAQLSGLETVFGEPSDDGLSAQLSDYWKAWGTVANNPGDATSRSLLLTSAQTVASTLNGLAGQLDQLTSSTSSALDQDLADASAAAAQLAKINGQVAVAVANGQNANSLLDQRDQLLGKLASAVGGVATIGPDGMASVTVGGQSLVTGNTATSIAADASHQVSVGGVAVTLSGGSASARVSALTITLPGYQAQLDGVAGALSSATNAIQAGGYDQDGNAGGAIFSGTGASAIAVALTDPRKIAASGTPGGNLDGSNALAASQQGSAGTGPDAAFATLVGAVASASAVAQQQQNVQDAVVSNVDGLKSSLSGVNYDEEVSQMLTYQHAFSASSRVLTTIDQMLDTLINHTGMVGLT
jgi:flagellar hook-associated protein 1 FlgK